MNLDKISSIYKLKNVIIRNENSGSSFDKQSVIIIEDIKGQRIVLDDLGNDITNSSMKVCLSKNKTKLKCIWKNKKLRNA